ncbi:urease accessory protein UreD [Sulfitobacter sp. D35]|uniref:urease accessory protein UreD n=1 Tax=Sulfitobacter sp. D35 TaxID=3083252 RepID=UPI00296ECDB1|nr:urease accessory protein UreD [Sulfitobacter sp. D35]MDW4497339.1 urease accessory protein UreD [Sulfitobacter sp. D35]
MTPAPPQATHRDQPRAIGSARLATKARDGGSHIAALHQSGASKLLFPRSRTAVTAILVNTAGGVTGGDRFELSGRAGRDSALVLTTQAAERVYRAQDGQTGCVTTRLEAEADARLHWLPQETILFEGAALHRSLTVDLAETARFVMVEPLIFGRTARGEDLRAIRFDDRVEVRRAGRPLFRDGLHLHGDVAAQLDRPAIGGGARAMASVLVCAPEAEAQMRCLQGLIEGRGGASLLSDGVLHLRLLARDGFELRQVLLPVLGRLTDDRLPTSWRL